MYDVEMYDGTKYQLVEISDDMFKYIPVNGECTTKLFTLDRELDLFINNDVAPNLEYRNFVYTTLPSFFLDFCESNGLMKYIVKVDRGYMIKHEIIQHFIFNWK